MRIMKNQIIKNYSPLRLTLLLVFVANSLYADPTMQVYQPRFDSEGRFWVYRNGITHPKMPFAPYGWMSDATNLTQIIQMDVECRDDPEHHHSASTTGAGAVYPLHEIMWNDANWASVAFISRPGQATLVGRFKDRLEGIITSARCQKRNWSSMPGETKGAK